LMNEKRYRSYSQKRVERKLMEINTILKFNSF